MSRSYKHTPGFTDNGPGRKLAKRRASKVVRRIDMVGDGSCYKKAFSKYDIMDWNDLLCQTKNGKELKHPIHQYYMK